MERGNGNKFLMSAVGAALLTLAGFWYAHINAETAYGEITRSRVTVLERRADETEKWRDDVKTELREVKAELRILNENVTRLLERRK
jgi:hypothetical protein